VKILVLKNFLVEIKLIVTCLRKYLRFLDQLYFLRSRVLLTLDKAFFFNLHKYKNNFRIVLLSCCFTMTWILRVKTDIEKLFFKSTNNLFLLFIEFVDDESAWFTEIIRLIISKLCILLRSSSTWDYLDSSTRTLTTWSLLRLVDFLISKNLTSLKIKIRIFSRLEMMHWVFFESMIFFDVIAKKLSLTILFESSTMRFIVFMIILFFSWSSVISYLDSREISFENLNFEKFEVFNPTRPDRQDSKPSPRARAPKLAQGSGSDKSWPPRPTRRTGLLV
jgi:hypothetical protein